MREISIREMSAGMILDQDLRSANGTLLVARNQEISYPLLVRIRNLNQKSPILEKIRVKIIESTALPSLETTDQTILQSSR
jgi:hypothetical protein